MKPVNIFALTRVANTSNIQKLERQMSGRSYFLPIKRWETDGLGAFVFKLLENGGNAGYEFFYSFQIPKLGKEFDLLRISRDTVVNIELKSGNVTDERIKHQLEQNRYYLYALGLHVRSYTFISDTMRLVRLTNGGHLVEESFETLCKDLDSQTDLFTGDIESLFKEEEFLISPLTDPEKFLRGDYFLTSQQKDIKHKILKGIAAKGLFFGFTGLPGTGKTLLLYDLAMDLSEKDKVCVFHYGSYPVELKHLDDRLKRIDFFHPQEKSVDYEKLILGDGYKAVLVDEGHRIKQSDLKALEKVAKENSIPVIFSYDSEDAISVEELSEDTAGNIEKLPEFTRFALTNRIRMNSELSLFIRLLMNDTNITKRSYPSVKILFARDKAEAELVLNDYRNKGFIYIRDDAETPGQENGESEINVNLATCREFDRVIMAMDESFYYDDRRYLRSKGEGESKVRRLFHGLSRAKKELSLVVIANEELFGRIIGIVQPYEPQGKKKKNTRRN